MFKVLITLSIICCFCSPANAATDPGEFDMLRLKWKNVLIGHSGSVKKSQSKKIVSITKEARENWEKMAKTAFRAFLWSDLSSDELSAHITKTYRRIYSMALAYSTKGSALEGNVKLRDDIISALDWMDRNRYVKMYNDWWDFQIGAPLELNNCIVLMYDDLSDSTRRRLCNKVERLIGNPNTDTGANRLWRAFVYIINGILKYDASKIETARISMGDVFRYTSKGDGYYADGSFVQHGDHPYNLGYGIDALSMTADLLTLLKSSPWEVNDPASQRVFQWVYDSYEPLIFNGLAMDMVRGREIARSYRGDYEAGMLVVGIMAKMAKIAPQDDATVIKGLIKQCLKSDAGAGYFDFAANAYNVPLRTISLVQEILDDDTIPLRPEKLAYRQYPNMDRAVKRGSGYAFGISMHSSRIANYEGDIKNENLHGWHTGDGMTYLYNADSKQFGQGFWPTVDGFRLPGTTVLSKSPIKSDRRSDRDWAGGAGLGEYGISGMEYHATGYDLQARKSWFMFDNEIVALGAGITSADGTTVETIVENRKLNASGNNRFRLVTHSSRKPTINGSGTYNNVSYAYLCGNVKGAEIGYYFPQRTDLKVLRETRLASWNTVNGNPAARDSTVHKNSFLTMWFDHGKNPKGATYSYVILPGFSKELIEKYVNKPSILIMRNDSLVQAVEERGLRVTAANFWTDTKQSAGAIIANKKASVILQTKDNQLTVAVSDPTMFNKGTITIEIDQAATGVLICGPATRVLRLNPSILLEIDVNGSMGATHTSKFQLK